MKDGEDITVVSYGSTFNLCVEASNELDKLNISCELIDIQTLIPFDLNKVIVKSLSKLTKLFL